ncbi:MAG TPA: methyltransferase [Polyangiaceae bacterium]|jgi:SAM-dependent methyltransferase|nr:methyltransferase [Polyangiaceae bacterium]
MDYSVPLAFERTLATLLPALDIIAQRVDDAAVPAWCSSRGWADYLLLLSEQDLERCEAEGLAVVAESLPRVPASLRELAARVCELSELPALDAPSVTQNQDFRGVSWRKQQQLSALLGALTPLVAQARRIVDVGAGSGHFTRLSARHFSREALGLERNAERVARASSREQADASARFSAQFAVVDAFRDGLALRADDLAIGLHACGELGDTLVRAVADSGADLALVSCCLQKIGALERVALSEAAHGLALHKETLGLSNLTSQAVGVETSIERTMQARQARYALRQLLRARGLEIAPGAEMHGINRRQAHAGLAEIAARSLSQRGLRPASAAELEHHQREATLHFHAVRRLSLPRNMLARAVELSVVLDRALHLLERGYSVRVATLFERAVTPRNISLFASRDAARLPRVRT